MEPELELDRRRPAGVGLGIDDRHNGIDVLVRVLVDPAEGGQIDRVRAGDPGGVECRRSVMYGDDGGAKSVRLTGHAQRSPERVVQDHDIRAHRSERFPQRAAAEREPVTIRGGKLERGELVASAGIEPAPPRYHQMVLECARDPRVPGLLVQVGADAAAPLGVEQGHVAHHEPGAVGLARGECGHAEYCVLRRSYILLLTSEGSG